MFWGLNSIFFIFRRWLLLFSILANCIHDESCTEKIAPISPKGPKFVVQKDLVVHRWRICNKRISAYFFICLTERVRLQKIFKSGEYAIIQRLCIAYAVCIPRINSAYAESTLSVIICWNRSWDFAWCAIFLTCMSCKTEGFDITSQSLSTSISNIFEQAIHRLSW